MPTSSEYREKAEKCYRLASEAKTETDRVACLDLARTWLEASSHQPEMTPEQIAKAQKLELVWQLKRETPQRKALSGWRQRLFGFFR
jgi:hypothetical protein